MLISEIGIRGYKSFGNNEQVVNLNTEKGELVLLVGKNGNGKSVIPTTEIEVEIPLENLNLVDLNIFLEIMGKENKYIEYLKENNYSLYVQYINQ